MATVALNGEGEMIDAVDNGAKEFAAVKRAWAALVTAIRSECESDLVAA